MMIIPFTGLLLYFNIREAKRLLKSGVDNSLPGLIKLVSDNGKEILTLSPDHIIYLEGQQNYVSIYYTRNGEGFGSYSA